MFVHLILYFVHIKSLQVFLKYFIKMLHNSKNPFIFVSVFHRILDFKAGLDFYLGPFFYF